MPQRTDDLELARLGLTSGEARRLDLHVHVDPFAYGGQTYAVASDARARAAGCLAHDPERLGAAAALRGGVDGPCVRCLEPAAPRFAVDAREVEIPGGGEELSSPYVDDDGVLDLAAWARDALALALPAKITCRPDCAGLARSAAPTSTTTPSTRTRPRPTRAGRSCPSSGSTSGPTPLPFSPPMAVPKQKQSHSRTNKRRSTHKISAPAINECPQCHQPRRPHRVCPHCGSYAGREVVHVHDDDHDHEH